jgi:hypothetical protein
MFVLLSNDAGIAATINGGIWAVLMPDGVEYPALSYLIVDSPPVASLKEPTGIAHPRIHLNANSYAEAKRASDAVLTLLARPNARSGRFRITRS